MTVEIRSPFPEYALPRVWQWMAPVRNRVSDDYGPKTLAEWVNGRAGALDMSWGVYRDGELGGMISFQRISPWLGSGHCIFRPDFWGRAITRPAVESALKEIFGSGIGKLTFLVFSDNRAIRSLLAEMGASVEGTLRKHTLRNGAPVDMVALAILKERYDADRNSSGADCVERDRGGSLSSGVCPVGQKQDLDQHHHADTIA